MPSPRKSGAVRKRGLTKKQEAFAHAYVETGNASEAYRRAYNAGKMQAKSVHQNASKLLADANVAPRVAELQAKVSAIAEDRYAVTQERIIAEVARCAFYRADDFFEWGPSGVVVKDSTKLTPDQIAAVCEASQSITTGTIKIKLADKLAALDKLARIMGMFVEKVEHSGSLNISNMSDEELANIAAGRGAGTAASS